MKKALKCLAAFLCVALSLSVFSSCATVKSTPVSIDDFRVTSYVVGSSCVDKKALDTSHFDQITDIILFGVATFGEDGEISLDDTFNTCLDNIRSCMKNDGSQRLYLNVLGPSIQSTSDDWYEQMDDLAMRNNKAFRSGKLENNIKDILTKYDFDGVFFDYEFPIKNKHWKVYNDFIVSLDKVLGDEFKIGITLVDWDAKQSKQAREATDLVELMSYDNWDDDGNHSTLELAKHDVKKIVKKGYDKSKIDLGVPFYARPTNKDAYWYDYKSYYDKLDDNGLYNDASQTGLTFSFNTYDVIKSKTDYAVSEGLGGVMIWHYACDLPADNEKSLFNAIHQSIDEAKNNTK